VIVEIIFMMVWLAMPIFRSSHRGNTRPVRKATMTGRSSAGTPLMKSAMMAVFSRRLGVFLNFRNFN